MNYFEKRVKISAEKKEKVLFYLYVLFVFIFLTISGKIINDLGIYNIGIGYKYNFNDLSKSVNLEERNKFYYI